MRVAWSDTLIHCNGTLLSIQSCCHPLHPCYDKSSSPSLPITTSAGGVEFDTFETNIFAVLAEWLLEQQLREPASQLPSLLATSPRSSNVNKLKIRMKMRHRKDWINVWSADVGLDLESAVDEMTFVLRILCQWQRGLLEMSDPVESVEYIHVNPLCFWQLRQWVMMIGIWRPGSLYGHMCSPSLDPDALRNQNKTWSVMELDLQTETNCDRF